MLRRLIGVGVVLTLLIQAGCGGKGSSSSSADPNASAAGGPVGGPVAGGPGVPAAESTEPGDVYARIMDSHTGALVVRVPKLLASPFGKSSLASELETNLRKGTGLELSQIDQCIVVFTGAGGASPFPGGSPYGPTRSESPYGPTPSGSPYGPGAGGSPYGPGAGGAPYGPPATGGAPYDRAAIEGPGSATTAPGMQGNQQAMLAALGPMLPSKDGVVTIVTGTMPFDQAKLKELGKLEATEQTAGNHSFFRSQNPEQPAVCFFDDKTLIVADQNALTTFLTASPASAGGSPYGGGGSPYGAAPSSGESDAPAAKMLGDRLRELPAEEAIYGTMKLGNLLQGFGAMAAAGAMGGASPAGDMSKMGETLQSLNLGINLSTGLSFTLVLGMNNADEATKLKTNLQTAQGAIGMAMAAMQKNAPASGTPEQQALRAKGFEAWDQLSKTLKVETGELAHNILISGSIDQPMVESLAAMMTRDVFMPPGSQQARALVMAQMKEINTAIHVHVDASGKLPTSAVMSVDGKPLLSWRVQMLPHLGQKELYDQFKLDEPWDSEHNKALVEKMPGVYKTPGVSDPGKTALLAPVSEASVFGQKDGATMSAVSDGASNTILFVQANPDRAVAWTAPEDLKFDPAKPTDGVDKAYPNIFLAAWLDGSVGAVALKTEKKTLAALVTMAGGEPVDMSALAAAATAATFAPPETAEEVESAVTKVAADGVEYADGMLGDAQRAINRGHDKEGRRLALAAAIAADDATLAKDTMQWCKGLTRPVHALRWGLAVMPDPKRRRDNNGTTAGAGEGARGAGAPYGPAAPYGPTTPAYSPLGAGSVEETEEEKEFYALTGDVGRNMKAALRERLDHGDFGELYKYDRKKPQTGNDAAIPTATEFERTPYGPGSGTPYGPGVAGPYGPGTPAAATDPAAAAAEAQALAEKAPRGLIVLGEGADRKELFDLAEEAEVDVLLVAEMTTVNTRRVDPAVRWVLLETSTKKRIGRESDPVPVPGATGGASGYPAAATQDNADAVAKNDETARKQNTAKYLKQLDQAMALKEVPELPPAKVLTHITKMVNEWKLECPLPLLLEVRYYQALGAVKPEEALPLVQKLAGDDEIAQQLVAGTEDERKAAVEQWLLPVPEDDAAGNGSGGRETARAE